MSKTASTVFEDTLNVFIDECRERGKVTMDDLIKYMRMLQEYESDSHIVIAGQNGTGKSMFMQILMKKMLGADYLDNFRFVDADVEDVLVFLADNRNTVLGMDEWNRLLGYKKHATKEQNRLIEGIELARSHANAVVGCIRDPDKLSLNYRNGKTAIIVWLLDRFRDGSGGYGVVLAANQMVEGEDRFGISLISVDTPDMASLRAQFEALPSFVGYIRMPPALDHLSKAEIEDYKERKDAALLRYAKGGKPRNRGRQSTLEDG